AGAFVVQAQELVTPRLVVEVEQTGDGAVDAPLVLTGVNGVSRNRTPRWRRISAEPGPCFEAPIGFASELEPLDKASTLGVPSPSLTTCPAAFSSPSTWSRKAIVILPP
ncbi:MAG: hypothetical protein ACRDRC_15315, partial [Pseudonocardiaceae bacterium]